LAAVGAHMAALLDEQIREAFGLFDADGTGTIDIEATALALKALGHGDFSKEDIERMLGPSSTVRNGLIDYAVFERLLKSKIGPRDGTEEIDRAYKMFDMDRKGGISLANLKAVAKMLGENPGDDILAEMITEADEDKDGEVSLAEFRTVMLHVRGS